MTMQTDHAVRRLGALALAASSSLFAVFPLVRPYFDLDVFSPTLAAVASGPISSPPWLAAHLLLTLAFALLPVGLVAVGVALAPAEDGPRALRTTMLAIAGAALTVPMVGVETFAMPQIGGLYIAQGADVTAILARVYRGPGTVVMILGLFLLTLGAAGLVRPMRRNGILPRWAGTAFALGFGFWLPMLPPPIRIADGLLIGLGGLALAAALWRSRAVGTAGAPPAGGLPVEQAVA